HNAGADLNIALPAGARLTRARLDGADIAPLEVDAQHLWLPLTGGSGLRILQLAWQFEANREDLLQPELAKPQLQDVPYVDAAAGTGRVAGAGRAPNQLKQKANPPESSAITGWTILIPPGYRVQTAKEDAAADSFAGQDLRRATALVRLSEELARDREVRAEAPQAQQLAAVQQQFYAYCQFAQMRLEGRERAGDTVALAAWLDRLQQLNEQLAASHHFEAVRAQAEERAKASPLVTRSSIAFNAGCYRAEAGLPSYWQANAGAPVPRVHLAAAEEDKARQRFGLSALLLLLCLIAWFLAYFPRVVAVLRAFWPEQLLVLGCLGWQLVSPNAGFALLVLVGIGGRIYLAVRWLVAFLQQRSTAAAAAGSGLA